MINLLARGLLGTARQSLYRWRQRGNDISSTPVTSFVSGFGRYSSFSHDGLTVAIATDAQGLSPADGSVRIYRWNGTQYALLGQELSVKLPHGSGGTDRFGTEVSLSADGNRVAMCTGVTGTLSTDKGYVYDFNGTQWVLNAQFSNVKSIGLSGSGNRLLIGAGIDNGNGTVVLDYNGTSWVQVGPNIPLEGYRLSISQNGNRIANRVGQILEFINGAWTPVVQLNIDAATLYGKTRLNADGTLFAFGAAVSYKETNGTWTQLTRPMINGSNTLFDLSASGRLLIRDVDSASGLYQTRVFDLVNNSWVQVSTPVKQTSGEGYAGSAICGDGKTIGIPQFSSPNSLPTGIRSYNVYRNELG